MAETLFAKSNPRVFLLSGKHGARMIRRRTSKLWKGHFREASHTCKGCGRRTPTMDANAFQRFHKEVIPAQNKHRNEQSDGTNVKGNDSCRNRFLPSNCGLVPERCDRCHRIWTQVSESCASVRGCWENATDKAMAPGAAPGRREGTMPFEEKGLSKRYDSKEVEQSSIGTLKSSINAAVKMAQAMQD